MGGPICIAGSRFAAALDFYPVSVAKLGFESHNKADWGAVRTEIDLCLLTRTPTEGNRLPDPGACIVVLTEFVYVSVRFQLSNGLSTTSNGASRSSSAPPPARAGRGCQCMMSNATIDGRILRHSHSDVGNPSDVCPDRQPSNQNVSPARAVKTCSLRSRVHATDLLAPPKQGERSRDHIRSTD